MVWLRQGAVSKSLTSFGDFGECEACTPLQIDILGEHQCTQSAKRLAGEEIGFPALLSGQLPRAVEVISTELHTHMLEILEQIRDGLPLAFGQNGFV